MHRILLLAPVFFFFSMVLQAQEEPFDDLLREKVVIDEPVYKPVIGFGTGVLNFHGDISNNFFNPVIGDNAFKFNVSTFVDPSRYFKANFFLIYGTMTGNMSSFSDLSNNINFKTEIINFGINAEYTFDHFIRKKRWIKPFLSAGLGNVQFTSKGDLFDSQGNFYHFWSDGTIRNIPESQSLVQQSRILQRDYVYETDLRKWENEQYGLGNYSKYAFSFPVDAGLDFRISDRVSCRLGTSMHFTMSDYLDNVSSEGTHVKGDSRNDWFSYSYFTIHLDLFSQPKEQFIDRLFAELEFDDVMFDDEDGDFVLDPVDECPGTPFGVTVDMRGCPIDSDGDGVPDYLDMEPDTPPGNWVDINGVTVTEEQYLAIIAERSDAMERDDARAYFDFIDKGYEGKIIAEIPDKYKILDLDNDGYISFDELLKSVDKYFDFRLDFKVQDIYELINFFFAQ